MKRIIWKYGEWTTIPRKYLAFVRKLNQERLSFLSNEDWEEIESETVLHIWKKRKLYNKKAPFFPWVKEVVKNQLMNQVRDRMFERKKRKSFLKEMFLSNSTSSDTHSFDYMDLSNSFKEILTKSEAAVFECKEKWYDNKKISKITGLKYASVACIAVKLRKKYQNYLNAR
jgi:DNA-directed RNA polymerase specialized sigma24 family protein